MTFSSVTSKQEHYATGCRIPEDLLSDTYREDLKTCTFKVLLQNDLEGLRKILKHLYEGNLSWTETCTSEKVKILTAASNTSLFANELSR